MARSGSSVPNNPAPSLHGLQAWTYDPGTGGSGAAAVTAATIYLGKMQIHSNFTASNLLFNLAVSGTGATAISNAQVGVYSSAGVLLGASAVAAMAAGGASAIDEATAPAAITVALAATSTGSLALTAGTWVWGALHIGAQSSTAAQIQFGTNAGATVANWNLAVTAARCGQYTGHATDPLATIGSLTVASITAFTRLPLMGLS